MEPVSITALVVGIISALAALLSRLRFKHCHCGCIDSDCIRTPDNTPPATPTSSKHNKRDDIYCNSSDLV